MIEAPEFRAEDGDFAVHTRWIETDFADRLAALGAHARVTPAAPRRCCASRSRSTASASSIGLPAGILAAGPGPAAAAAQRPAADAEDAVTAPVAGTLQVWQAADGATSPPARSSR